MEKEPEQHKTSAEAPGEAEHDEVIEAGASLEYFKALREKAGESGISNVQRADFKTAVDLDEMKKQDQRMGLKQLYALWCEKGNAKWLNPSKELGRLRDICLLYMGNVSTLRPLVQILLKLTNHGVSPHAFLHYVVLPRMGDDFDWRQWHQRHFGALSIIADMVIEIKKHPPFDKEILGSSSYPLARDIVIIKYFARPLCSLSEKQLAITEYQKAYIDLWRGFYLDNSLHIYFLKRNILPVLYRYAAKLEFNQLIQILANVPKIENAFRSFYPDTNGPVDENEMSLHLYHRDFLLSVAQREQRKFTTFHFTQELKAYVHIIASLLNARSGIYLCNFFAKIMRQKKDPIIAEALNRLINLIEDDGGMFVYQWHAERMIRLPKSHMEIFLNDVLAGRGLHPDYPRIHHLFNHRNDEVKREHLRGVAESLGIWDETLQNAYDWRDFSERTVLTHYMARNAEAAEIIQKARHDICEGHDDKWDAGFIEQLDSLGNNVFRLVLKSVIPALNTGFSTGAQHMSFGEMRQQFQDLEFPKDLHLNHTFNINTYSPELGNRLIEDKVRLKINLSTIQQVFDSLTAPQAPAARNLVMILNELKLKMESTVRRLKASHSNAPSVPAGLLQRLSLISAVIEAHEKDSKDEQFILTLMAAAYLHKEDELRQLAIQSLLFRYSSQSNLAEKISILGKDIAIGALQPRQLEYLIRVCEDFVESAIRDSEIAKCIEQAKAHSPQFVELCLSLSKVRSRIFDAVHIDAAVTKILNIQALKAEASRWLKLIVAEEQIRANPEKFCIRLNKAPLDYYFGHMGGTCLSSWGSEIKHPDFVVLRLSNLKTNEIIGFSLAVQERNKPPSIGPRRWLAFAFNIAHSMRTKYTSNEKLLIYLHFRYVYEQLAQRTRTPVILCGIGEHQVVSNDAEWQKGIVNFERITGGIPSTYAYMSRLVYEPRAFSRGILIIDPKDPKTFRAQNFFRLRAGSAAGAS